jgi:hypothetical protein
MHAANDQSNGRWLARQGHAKMFTEVMSVILALSAAVVTLKTKASLTFCAGQRVRDGGKTLAVICSQAIRRYLILCMWLMVVAGCGDSSGSKLVPVVGKITVNGQPLTMGTGSVSFRPEKGSANVQEPAGMIEKDGTYRLLTGEKEGAPTGRYQVLVTVMEPIDLKSPFPYGKRKSYVNPKYGDPKTSDLFTEVVPSPAPGAYDLKLTK